MSEYWLINSNDYWLIDRAVSSIINDKLCRQIQSEGVQSGPIGEFNFEFDFPSTYLSCYRQYFAKLFDFKLIIKYMGSGHTR